MLSNQYTSEPSHHNHDLQIDPSLLLAASDLSVAGDQHQHPPPPGYSADAHRPITYTQPAPIPVFIKLHAHSAIQAPPDCWLGLLTYGSIGELRHLAREKHDGAAVVRIEGVVKDAATGGDISYCIDDDAKLGGYLAHVSGGQATFVVRLIGDGYVPAGGG